MDGQLFCPDNSGYAEKRVQSYDFFLYLANFQVLSLRFLSVFYLFFFFVMDFSHRFRPFRQFILYFCIHINKMD